MNKIYLCLKQFKLVIITHIEKHFHRIEEF